MQNYVVSFFAAANIYIQQHQIQWSQKINKPTLQYFVLSMLQQLPFVYIQPFTVKCYLDIKTMTYIYYIY